MQKLRLNDVVVIAADFFHCCKATFCNFAMHDCMMFTLPIEYKRYAQVFRAHSACRHQSTPCVYCTPDIILLLFKSKSSSRIGVVCKCSVTLYMYVMCSICYDDPTLPQCWLNNM